MTSSSSSIITATTAVIDNITNLKIENATEGLPYTCFNYLANRVFPFTMWDEIKFSKYIDECMSKSDHTLFNDYIQALKSEDRIAEFALIFVLEYLQQNEYKLY